MSGVSLHSIECSPSSLFVVACCAARTLDNNVNVPVAIDCRVFTPNGKIYTSVTCSLTLSSYIGISVPNVKCKILIFSTSKCKIKILSESNTAKYLQVSQALSHEKVALWAYSRPLNFFHDLQINVDHLFSE